MSKTVYEIVTEKVLETMAAGVIAWRKPWNANAVRPCNAESMRPYSGGNMFLLGMLPFATPAFLTFNQIKKAGATIKAGEEKKHYPVFYWKWLEKKNDVTGKVEKIPMLRYFLVWNVEQLDGYEMNPKLNPQGDAFNHDPIAAAEKIAQGYDNAPEVVIAKTNRACYYPQLDKINAPELSQYANPQEYYSTLFHEMAHSTGHKSRLNRKEVNDPITFGSHDYSLEEMVAELTAAFLCAESGLDNTIENSAAYIKGWHSKLSSDPKLFWTAAGRAQKAADHILGRKPVTDAE